MKAGTIPPGARLFVLAVATLLPGSLLANAKTDISFAAASDTDKVTQPDNSKQNTQHDGEKGLSAEQQSNTESDVEITRKIRQALVKDKSLSTYAHNVKIITESGEVVLKGPVRSLQEKQIIEGKAGRIAGLDRVRSELEVTPQ
jgi:hyperosmotically inducible protein